MSPCLVQQDSGKLVLLPVEGQASSHSVLGFLCLPGPRPWPCLHRGLVGFCWELTLRLDASAPLRV